MPEPKAFEWDDFMIQGNLSYRKAVHTFDRARGVKFTTLFWTILSNDLIGMFHKAQRIRRPIPIGGDNLDPKKLRA